MEIGGQDTTAATLSSQALCTWCTSPPLPSLFTGGTPHMHIHGGTYLAYICTCTHVHTMEDVFSYFGMRMHTHTHANTNACMYARTHLHTSMHAHKHTDTHTRTCTHMYPHTEIFHGISSAQLHDVEELTARAVFSSCLGHVITVAQQHNWMVAGQVLWE